jgi:hypothetical protein
LTAAVSSKNREIDARRFVGFLYKLARSCRQPALSASPPGRFRNPDSTIPVSMAALTCFGEAPLAAATCLIVATTLRCSGVRATLDLPFGQAYAAPVKARRILAVPLLAIGGLLFVACCLATIGIGFYAAYLGINDIADGNITASATLLFAGTGATILLGALTIPAGGLMAAGEWLWDGPQPSPPTRLRPTGS